MAKKKKKNSFRRERMNLGWQNISSLASSQSGDEDGLAGLASGENLVPQSTTQLDFGRKRWVKLIRVILRLIIVVIGDGSALRNVRSVAGMRMRGIDQADTVGDNPGLLGTEANDPRADWLYRDSWATQVASNGNEIVRGFGGGPIVWDFKPGRRMGPEEQLVVHHHHVLSDTDSTNFDGTVTLRLEGRLLWGSPV